MLFSVNFDLYFSSLRWSSVIYLEEDRENDWKLLGRASLIPGFHCRVIRKGASHFIGRSPSVTVFSLELFFCSGEEFIHSHLPELLKWGRERRLGRASHQLLSDFYFLLLFLTPLSAMLGFLFPKYLLASVSRDKLTPSCLMVWPDEGAWGREPECLATLFRLLANLLFASPPLTPHPHLLWWSLRDSLEQLSSLSSLLNYVICSSSIHFPSFKSRLQSLASCSLLSHGLFPKWSFTFSFLIYHFRWVSGGRDHKCLCQFKLNAV